MSNEFTITHQGDGAALYVILRRTSDAKVWSVASSSFGTWADGSIDDYDIAMTARGGDLYTADFPSAIAAGTRVLAYYYFRAGASPAVGDLILNTDDLLWNGQDATQGSTVSLSAGALTSLASVKRYLRITSTEYDDLITELINQISDRMKRLIGRDLVATDYFEWISGDREQTLRLKHWPVIRFDRLAYGRQNSFHAQYQGTDIRATISVYDDGVRLWSIDAAGSVTSTNLDNDTYPTASTMVAAIEAVADWTATLVNDCQSAAFNLMGGQDAKADRVYLTYPHNDIYSFDVDHQAGLIEYRREAVVWDDDTAPNGWAHRTGAGPGIAPRRAQRGHVNILAQYRAGHETIPDDIALTANEMVAEMYRLSARDTSVRSEQIDNYRYENAAQIDFTQRQLQRLAPYMEIR